MGKVEVLQILEKGDKLTSVEIAEQSGCGFASVRTSIKRLLKDVSENVEFRVLTPEEKHERFGKTVGCKIHLYWIKE